MNNPSQVRSLKKSNSEEGHDGFLTNGIKHESKEMNDFSDCATNKELRKEIKKLEVRLEEVSWQLVIRGLIRDGASFRIATLYMFSPSRHGPGDLGFFQGSVYRCRVVSAVCDYASKAGLRREWRLESKQKIGEATHFSD